ncbi:hypothetical protein [Marivirga sp.]|uniref:hypothetical protein n=1 Tax=Marivirga sp. TaxID=2018662 RepID=UPI0025D92056|nr:hypothetical protein [Marivirga sp.]
MKRKVILNIEDFLNDFHYFKLKGYDVFQYPFQNGSKLIVINSTPYEDGLMLEIQLAVRIDKLEELIFNFYKQETDKLSLSYYKNIAQIYSDMPKRYLIQNEIQLSRTIAEIENALVKKGFNWLDELANLNTFSSYLIETIFKSTQKPTNIFKLCQRSYLMRLLLGEKITDAIFYEYYEQLQLSKAPEHQLEEFIEFNKFLKAESI